MAKKQPIKTVTLDPDVWVRDIMPGEPTSLLFFVDEQRQQCCIGVACTALGLKDDAIRGKEYAHSLADLRLPAAIRALATLRSGTDVYQINDERGAKDADRVRWLNAELRRKHVPLRFRLKKPRTLRSTSKAKRAVTPAASEAQ